MNIEKINVSNQFKKKYLKFGKNVFTRRLAFNAYPRYAKQIMDAFSVKSNNNEKVIKKFNYPSYDEMQHHVHKQAKEILNTLNITPTKNALQQFSITYKLFNYFSENLTYNMIAQEERGKNFEDNFYLLSGLKKSKQKLKLLDFKCALPTERKQYRVRKTAIYNNITKTSEKLRSKVSRNELNYMRSLYNVFIRKQGTCLDFTNSFNYIAKMANINTYKVVADKRKNGKSFYHAYSLVECSQKGKKTYYACDLTSSVCSNKYLQNKENYKILGYGLGVKDLTKSGYEILSIQKHEDNNQGEYELELQERLIEKNLPTSLIKKVVQISEQVSEQEAGI